MNANFVNVFKYRMNDMLNVILTNIDLLSIRWTILMNAKERKQFFSECV